MRPYIVLGTHRPQRWNAREIGLHLCDLTRQAGLIAHWDPTHGPLERVPWHSVALHAEVRRRSFRTKMAEDWHYDGDTTEGSKPDCAIVLWASNNPTLIKVRGTPNAIIYQPKPYEIVIFSNIRFLHRRPPNVPRIRWVFRQRVKLPTNLELP